MPKATPAPQIFKLSKKLPRAVSSRIKRDLLSGKGMDACHRRIRAETGIWIPELVPIFKKLDRVLGLPKR